jgi:hypothetical protein
MTDRTLSRIKIDQTISDLWEQRDKTLNNDPDAPRLPPEMWENAIVGKYQPRKRTVKPSDAPDHKPPANP